jgi:cbb3-type cytochrome oxidase subunit 3
MTFGALATLLVSLAFAGLLYWVLNPRNKTRLQSYASIPLEDDNTPPVRREESPR